MVNYVLFTHNNKMLLVINLIAHNIYIECCNTFMFSSYGKLLLITLRS